MIQNLRHTVSVFLFVLAGLLSRAQGLNDYGTMNYQGTQSQPKKVASIAGTWEVGAMIGPDFYYGDLNLKKFMPDNSVSFAGSVYGTRQFTNVFGLRAQLFLGGARGSKYYQEGSQTITSSFSGFLMDFSISPVINFSNMISAYRSSRKVFVLGMAGVGFSGWNSTLVQEKGGVISNPPQVQGFQAAFMIPFGLGLQYNITPKISVGAEFTVRTIFSDLLDQSAGGYKCDIVNFLGFSASYRLGKAKKNMGVKDYSYMNPVPYQAPAPPVPASVQPSPPMPKAPSAEVYDYAVQVCAYAKHNYSTSWVKKHYRIKTEVLKESENGLNRYILATFYKDVDQAKEVCDRLRKQGIHDAWVIAYQNGVRHHVVIY
jgi:hypothetical protein